MSLSPIPWLLKAVIISLLSLVFLHTGHAAEFNSVTYDKLKSQLEHIRKKTNTPGIAVALSNPKISENKWLFTSGYADLKTRKTLEQSHIFRTGSVSKLVVAIAIMQLVESGKLNVDDHVREVLPDLKLRNKWNNTHPLKVAHLLNHSSGWDAPHFYEQIPNKKQTIDIETALGLYPDSRTSRWPPGSRTAYNNTGYLVLAAIVEKISQKTFEDYVTQHIFSPLKMHSSSYFYSDDFRHSAVTQYRHNQPVPYQHLNNRAAGGLNSNITDLLKLANLFRDTSQNAILTNTSVMQMQTPQNNAYSNKGITVGWGYGPSQMTRNGVTWFGHEGSLRGASAFVGWHPETQTSIVILANANTPAISLILKGVSTFLSAESSKVNKTTSLAITPEHKAMSGYYKTLNPISSLASITSLLPWRLQVIKEQALIKPVFGPPRFLSPAKNHSFTQAHSQKTVLTKGKDPLAGEVLFYGPNTMEKTSAIVALGPIFILVSYLFVALITLLIGLFWIPVRMFSKKKTFQNTAHRLIPMGTALVTLLAILIIFMGFSSNTPYLSFGQVTFASLLLFSLSVVLPASIIWHIWVLLKRRKQEPLLDSSWGTKALNIKSYAMATLGLLTMLILASHGYLGWMTWL